MNSIVQREQVDEKNPDAAGAGSWEAAGYERVGPRAYRRGPYRFEFGDKWLSASAPAGELRPQLGHIGCWKAGGARVDVVDLPIAAFRSDEADGDSPDGDAFQPLSAWIEASHRGELPAGWAPPDAATIRAGVEAAAWSLQVGPHVRSIELDVGPERLALRTTIAAAREDLSPARCQWLRRQVGFVHERRRWVRLGVVGSEQRPVVVGEIDLSGCPVGAISALVRPALWSLRYVVEQLLPTAVSLTDSRVRCDSWEQPANQVAVVLSE